MVNRSENMPVRIEENFRGGTGEVIIKDLTAGKKPGSVRDCNEMTLFRGCSVGFHSHNGVGEVIYVLYGEGVYSDGEAETHVRAGDALVCFDGEGHAIRNEREAPLKILAFIVAE